MLTGQIVKWTVGFPEQRLAGLVTNRHPELLNKMLQSLSFALIGQIRKVGSVLLHLRQSFKSTEVHFWSVFELPLRRGLSFVLSVEEFRLFGTAVIGQYNSVGGALCILSVWMEERIFF